MTLFKNVDIKDLQSILTQGILPISVTGNDNWEDGYRTNNSEDVVYLFNALKGDTFTQYGLALVEVEVEATVNEMSENDFNKDSYVEYICDSVKSEQILNVYIPSFVECDIDDYRIKKVEYTCKYLKATGRFSYDLVNLDGEIKKQFEATALTSTYDFNYLRGRNFDRTMIDTKDWKYEL